MTVQDVVRASLSETTALFEGLTPVILGAKVVGSIAGSIISLAYILPRGRREAALRLAVGLITGLVFGSTVGLKTAETLGLLEHLAVFETTLIGSTLASLCAWWALGVLHRVQERWSPGKGFVQGLGPGLDPGLDRRLVETNLPATSTQSKEGQP